MQFEKHFLAPIATEWTGNIEHTFWNFSLLEDEDFFCLHTGHIPESHLILQWTDQIWKPFIWKIFCSLILHEFFFQLSILFSAVEFIFWFISRDIPPKRQVCKLLIYAYLPMLIWYNLFILNTSFLLILWECHTHTQCIILTPFFLLISPDPFPLSQLHILLYNMLSPIIRIWFTWREPFSSKKTSSLSSSR